LEGDADGEGVAGTEPVAEGGAEHGAGDVEEVDNDVPAEYGGEGRARGEDVCEDGGGVDAEGVRGELGEAFR
jgi:hypothetical protein